MLHDVVQRKKFYTLVLQKCLTRSQIGEVRLLLILIDYYFLTVKRGLYYCIRTESILQTKKGPAMQVQWNYKESPFQIEFFTTA